MDNLLTALILSIVEGLTEFLPVSSSGHLILVGDLLNFVGDRAATFEVVIQLGAIMAVVVLYWKRFWGLVRPQPYVRFAGMRGIWLLILTSLPASVMGLLFHSMIKEYLFRPATVLIALVVGAVCMILVERRKHKPTCISLDDMTPRLALGIGCFQCLALWPGFSRSASTIMGGMLLGAKEAYAVDIEENATRIAKENAAENHLNPENYTISCGNIITDTALRESIGSGYDVITANIVADVIKGMAPLFPSFLKDNGILILSGIITERADEVLDTVTAYDFAVLERREASGWCAVKLQKLAGAGTCCDTLRK